MHIKDKLYNLQLELARQYYYLFCYTYSSVVNHQLKPLIGNGGIVVSFHKIHGSYFRHATRDLFSPRIDLKRDPYCRNSISIIFY